MYIFQIKTFTLQYTGLLLCLFMGVHSLFSKEAPNFLKHWSFRLIILFLCWQVFKSWDSICTDVSYRQLSRIIWLPIIALSIPYFFKTKVMIERLITVVIITAVIVNAVMWLLYYDAPRFAVFGSGPQDAAKLTDLGHTFLGPWIEAFFYPGEFSEFINRKEGKMFPLTSYSFYPGKHDAATFGSKNFITAYLNLTSCLMLYRAVVIFMDSKKKWYHFVLSAFLIIVVCLSFFQIMQLGNRGSQLGTLGACGAFVMFFLFKYFFTNQKVTKKSKQYLVVASFLGLCMFTFGFYKVDEQRFLSIFSVTAGSNELRRHTWTSYFKAWKNDEQFLGFENGAWRMMTGLGTYTFRVIYPKYRSQRIFQIEYNQHNTETSHPHNEYLGYLGELGIVGLLLYIFMISLILWRLVKKKVQDRQLQTYLLNGMLLFGVVSQLVHQTVGVGIRYTGVAFQFWLMLGIVLAVIFKREDLNAEIKEKKQVVGFGVFVSSILIVFIATAGVFYPVQLMRSQHFYEMGQIHYGWVREQQNRMNRNKQQYNQMLAYKDKLKKAGQRNEKLDADLPKMKQGLDLMQKQFDELYKRADKYFEAGYEYDRANFESLYIGANMNIQFANQALGVNDDGTARRLFNQAKERYEKVSEKMPFFVQVRYWQGVCYKGIGTSFLVKMRQDNKDRSIKVKEMFKKAIEHYNLYDLQDPIFRESYYDKFYIYLTLKEIPKALKEIKQLLLCYEQGGYFLIDPKSRFDVRKMLQHYIAYADNEAAKEALQIFSKIEQFHEVQTLLPFVPVTDRHTKNALEFIN